MLYRLRKSNLLTLLHDYPAIQSKMKNVAQSRQRRLAHYLDPKEVTLAPGDEIDTEDCKTALFGMDAEKILVSKEAEMNAEMISSGRSGRKTGANVARRRGLPVVKRKGR